MNLGNGGVIHILTFFPMHIIIGYDPPSHPWPCDDHGCEQRMDHWPRDMGLWDHASRKCPRCMVVPNGHPGAWDPGYRCPDHGHHCRDASPRASATTFHFTHAGTEASAYRGSRGIHDGALRHRHMDPSYDDMSSWHIGCMDILDHRVDKHLDAMGMVGRP
jgi:hypothetical protein